MKQHARIGGETLDAASRMNPEHSYLLMARDIAMTHHERYDGKGYPNGLKGTEIPLCGRIVALADAYDAMTTKRVYKDAYTHEVTAQIIVDDAGRHFDPYIVDAFLGCSHEFNRIRDLLADVSERSGAKSRATFLAPGVPGANMVPGIVNPGSFAGH
jgi:putative two-component system response regulator